MDLKLLLLMPIAFICEFIDSSLGMGYGTTLTPLLLIMGFEPLMVVPAVLLSEFVSGITAAFFHHSLHNVNFKRNSSDTKIAAVLSIFAVFGTIVAVIVAVKLPTPILKIWIGAIVVSMAIIILTSFKMKLRFSWIKIILLGTVASFNKGMSGGGYGPVVMGGQILSGVNIKNAIGITSLSEGVTCLVGLILYACFRAEVDWTLAPWLMAGAVLSVPMAAHTVKKISEQRIKLYVSIVILLLGCLTLGKVILNF